MSSAAVLSLRTTAWNDTCWYRAESRVSSFFDPGGELGKTRWSEVSSHSFVCGGLCASAASSGELSKTTAIATVTNRSLAVAARYVDANTEEHSEPRAPASGGFECLRGKRAEENIDLHMFR